MIDQQNCKVKNNGDWDSICPFPIGFVYLSSVSTSPANIYGGQWTELDDGRFLRPNGSWNETGGTFSHHHDVPIVMDSPTYDRNQVRIISWRNGDFLPSYGVTPYTGGRIGNYIYVNTGYSENVVGGSTSADSGLNMYTSTDSTLPSYRTVYCWYRTA